MSDHCERCGAPLFTPGGSRVGRPAKYCSAACRQAAHRARTTPTAPGARGLLPGQRQPSQTDRTEETPRTQSGPAPARTVGDEFLAEIIRDLQEGMRELLRTDDGEDALRRVAQMYEQMDALTAGLVGRARQRRVTWGPIAAILRISEDTARHRYTDAYILRKLARFTRSRIAPPSLNALYADATADESLPPTADKTPEDPAPAEETPTTPRDPSGAAFNRLAPVLSMLARASQLPLKDISLKIGCSASYLSRVLNGERIPTWRLTERFARVCGADPSVLRTVWETERLRDKGDFTPPPPEQEEQPLTAVPRLLAALRTLHVRAGQPRPLDIAVATKWRLTAEEIAAILEGTVLPPWKTFQRLLHILGGNPTDFERLWKAATREHYGDVPAPPAPPAPGAGPAMPAPVRGFDAVLTQFRQALSHEPPLVEDQRARLLQRAAERRRATASRSLQATPQPPEPGPRWAFG
ncbi:helix-turn-helix domain-containing protein [Streptomyces melanogenes]|uniref:helix-turn-helix domain-containing protein n=1 Tax=Streptomyces melanogenes TaxID=67326 RepID=UPI00167DD3D5|nr:helix-turn-helix transcriptional regulator [Streptomyces melanogenes]GGP93336.1 hypothetical protein GCM10010278_84170 [Streptomyces melanogenes]